MPKSRLSLAKLLPVLPEEVAAKLADIAPDTEVCRKQFTGHEMTIADGERASIGYITTKSVDRDGDILLPQGAKLDAYQANPVVLWAHNSSLPPIGKAIELSVDEYGIKSKTQYAETERANEVWQLVRGGFLNAHSIGFIPLEWVDRGTKGWDAATKGIDPADLEGASRVFTRYEVLEYSVVPVPCNQTALVEAVGKGLEISPDTLKSLGVDVTHVTSEYTCNDELTTPQISMPAVKALPSINLPTVASVPSLALPQVKLVRQAPDYDAIVQEALARIKGQF